MMVSQMRNMVQQSGANQQAQVAAIAEVVKESRIDPSNFKFEFDGREVAAMVESVGGVANLEVTA